MVPHHQTSAESESEPGSRSPRGNCCPLYHEAVELVGRRWTGAILRVLLDGSLRFSEIAQAIPELSDRLLSERMKELEARGIVERTVLPGPPLRVRYQLSTMGAELEPALTELESWARRWLGDRPAGTSRDAAGTGQHTARTGQHAARTGQHAARTG
ncbi:MAG: helix-turn-helix domain-containing protein, partial [Solirubrobacteraceae bacterium]